jgi:hypothetical protein
MMLCCSNGTVVAYRKFSPTTGSKSGVLKPVVPSEVNELRERPTTCGESCGPAVNATAGSDAT